MDGLDSKTIFENYGKIRSNMCLFHQGTPATVVTTRRTFAGELSIPVCEQCSKRPPKMEIDLTIRIKRNQQIATMTGDATVMEMRMQDDPAYARPYYR